MLGTPVRMPLCFDEQRLYRAIGEIYDNPGTLAERFHALYGGFEPHGELGALLRCAGKSVVTSWLEEKLVPEDSLDDVAYLVSEFLVATGDLEAVIDIIIRIDAARGRSTDRLEALLKLVSEHHLPVNGAGISEKENTFRDIEAGLGKLLQPLESSAGKLEPPRERIARRETERDYLLNEAISQFPRLPDEDQNIRAMGRRMHGFIAQYPDQFESTEPPHYLRLIYEGTYRNGLILTESAWKRIDAEQDVEILKPLCALSLVENDNYGFWKWRLHVLESPAFRQYLTAA
jgi:hypothetical protein